MYQKQEEEEENDDDDDENPATTISLTNDEEGDCSLCWDTALLVKMRNCDHRFCRACLVQYFKVQIDEANVLEIDCPSKDCDEIVHESDLESVLEASDFSRLQQLIFLAEIRQDPNARWCPQTGCESVVRLDPNQDAFQKLTCGECQYEFCGSCGFEYHPKKSCRQAEKRAKKKEKKALGRRKAKEQKETLKTMKRQGFTKCPGCSAMVEKHSGCNHMTCRCGREFCYICGETILSLDLHYSASACRGLQYSDVIELTTGSKVAQVARYAALPVVAVGAVALALAVVPVGAAVFGVYKLGDIQRRRRRSRRIAAAVRRRRPSETIGHREGEEFRILTAGASGVGKSATIIQLAQHQFVEYYDPTIEDSYLKYFNVDSGVALLNIYESSDMEEYVSVRSLLYRRAQYFILIYDITNRATFEQLNLYLDRIRAIKDVEDLPPTIIVGNKRDLAEQRQVTVVEGQNLARAHNTLFLESSAKDLENTQLVFALLVRAAKRNHLQLVP